MHKPLKVSCKLLLLLASLPVATSTCWPQAGNAAQASGPDAELKEFHLDELETLLQTMPPGTEHDYFAGMLASRTNRIEESIEMLNKVLPAIREARPDRAKEALDTLANDYMEAFRYGDMERTIDDLVAHFAVQYKPAELQQIKDNAAIARILREAPPQTIEWHGAVALKTERNPINSLNAELTVNGVEGQWLLDTGAGLSVVTKSFAERLGLKALPGASRTQGGTGIENPLQIALLPTLELGGATLHNVVVMILDDSSLNISFGKDRYQINGIVGYPVFRALGRVTFTHDGEFRAGEKDQLLGHGAKMFMKGLSPIVQCKVEGKMLPFGFDTGASGTALLLRYAQTFQAEAKTWKKAESKPSGAGGVVKRKVYIQPEVKLGIGDKVVTLKKVTIYRSSTLTDTEELYGNLGQDVVADFQSFTLDFSAMTFQLGETLSTGKGQ
ncbi:MAG TPA: pepsin/retropepsin-like aspartic protease family protein [Candidatus Acidoferrum sp.]|nr:pepsin/retropepsin-like aspartic protease family protein [Candidatus Acidoferrum sp.]